MELPTLRGPRVTLVLLAEIHIDALVGLGGDPEVARWWPGIDASVALTQPTDWLVGRANALADLAVVLQVAGRPDEATSSLEAALALYEQKGDLVDAARVRELLAATGATPS